MEAIRLMTSKNVRRLVVVDVNNKMIGIITEKDIFSQISKSPNMLTDFVGQNHPGEHKEVYSRFTEYMFDLLPKI
jgi:CBS domain-containing protein